MSDIEYKDSSKVEVARWLVGSVRLDYQGLNTRQLDLHIHKGPL